MITKTTTAPTTTPTSDRQVLPLLMSYLYPSAPGGAGYSASRTVRLPQPGRQRGPEVGGPTS
jgi:hypothetical protein